MADVMINLLCARQTRTQALYFSGKKYAFLVSPRLKPADDWTLLEVGENCLIQV